MSPNRAVTGRRDRCAQRRNCCPTAPLFACRGARVHHSPLIADVKNIWSGRRHRSVKNAPFPHAPGLSETSRAQPRDRSFGTRFAGLTPGSRLPEEGCGSRLRRGLERVGE
jgi:hypothetical protein